MGWAKLTANQYYITGYFSQTSPTPPGAVLLAPRYHSSVVCLSECQNDHQPILGSSTPSLLCLGLISAIL